VTVLAGQGTCVFIWRGWLPYLAMIWCRRTVTAVPAAGCKEAARCYLETSWETPGKCNIIPRVAVNAVKALREPIMTQPWCIDLPVCFVFGLEVALPGEALTSRRCLKTACR
jgi:hypothetical protein